MSAVEIVGHAWFAEDDYDAFRSILTDRRWHATYDQWLAAANQVQKRYEEGGTRVVRAHVHSGAFVQWCIDTGRRIDTQALTAFANEVAIREHLKMHPH